MGLIRFLLALAVALAHTSGWTYFPGKEAVEVFYIISGFYMSMILNEKYLQKKGSYKLFITNRFLRLFPSYWVVLLLTVVFSVIVYEASGHQQGGGLRMYLLYHKDLSFTTVAYLVFTNIFLFFQDLACFFGLNTATGNLYFTRNFYQTNPMVVTFLLVPQAWTIGLELLYYLIAPFLVRRSLYLILLLIALSFILRVALIHAGMHYDPWNYRFFPNEILFFLLGNISYRIYVYMKSRIASIKNGPVILYGLFFFITLFTLSFQTIIKVAEPRYIQVLYFCVFFCCLPFIFLLTRKSKLDRLIGELSYPIYISHILMAEFCASLNIPNRVLSNILAIALTLVFSLLINKFLIERIEKYRQKRVAVNAGIVAQT